MSIIYTGSTGPYIVKWNELLFSDNLHFRYSFISYALEVYSHWVFNWSVISSGKKINLSLYSHHCLPFIIMFIVRATSISCKEGRFPVNLWPGILSFRQGTKRYPSLKKSMPDGRSNSSGLIKWEKFSTMERFSVQNLFFSCCKLRCWWQNILFLVDRPENFLLLFLKAVY